VLCETRGFLLWYVDGFAGTGSRTVAGRVADLFDEESEPQEIDGSAKIALAVDPRAGWIRALGNAVNPRVVESIATNLLDRPSLSLSIAT